MQSPLLHSVLQHLRQLTETVPGAEQSDAKLLERFVRQGDEDAFAILLHRHGPLVWGLCGNILQDLHEAEDAFQATFLVLVRKAHAIRRRAALASWLHGVAYRIAVRAKAHAARRTAYSGGDVEAVAAAPLADLYWQDVGPLLHEEVERLPMALRTAIICCYLQGQSRAEAARELGCTETTLKGRLERARERLRIRLTRRGLTVTAGLGAAVLTRDALSAAVPGTLTDATRRAALLVASGEPIRVLSVRVAQLTEGMLRTMFIHHLKFVAALVMALGVLAASAGALSYSRLAAKQDDAVSEAAKSLRQTRLAQETAPPRTVEPASQALSAKDEPKPIGRRGLAEIPSAQEGILVLIGSEIKHGETVPEADQITLVEDGVMRRYRRLKEGEKVKPGQLLARLDDRLARDEVEIKKAKIVAAEADRQAAAKTYEEAKARYDTAQKLRTTAAAVISAEDLRGALITKERYEQELISKGEQVTIARLELKKTQTVLDMYHVRSRVAGTITYIYKLPGEAVKKLEPVVQIRISEEHK